LKPRLHFLPRHQLGFNPKSYSGSYSVPTPAPTPANLKALLGSFSGTNSFSYSLLPGGNSCTNSYSQLMPTRSVSDGSITDILRCQKFLVEIQCNSVPSPSLVTRSLLPSIPNAVYNGKRIVCSEDDCIRIVRSKKL
jgi:hypothetical protein